MSWARAGAQGGSAGSTSIVPSGDPTSSVDENGKDIGEAGVRMETKYDRFSSE